MGSANPSTPSPRCVQCSSLFPGQRGGRRGGFTCSDSGDGGSDGGGGRGHADFRKCSHFRSYGKYIETEIIKRTKVEKKKKGERTRVKTLTYQNR